MVHVTRRMFVSGAIATLAAPVLSTVHVLAQDTIPTGAVEATFMRAVDGEKIKARIGVEIVEVRLIGVDAPETKIDKDTTECFAQDSRDLLASLLADQTIYLEGDQEDKDGKDRLWRHVWATIDGNPTLINEYALAQGWAVTQEEKKNTKHQEQMIAAQKSAQAAKLGVWGSCESGHQAIARHGSKQDPGELGEELTGDNMTVSISDPFFTYDYNYSTPKGGYKFLIFNSSLQYNGDGKKDYRSIRFEVRDLDTDAKHNEAFVLLDQPLGDGDLSTGSYVNGQVALEVQETATNLLFQYQVDNSGVVFLYWHVQM